MSFHSTKEGFKGAGFCAIPGPRYGFPFHQGRFQGYERIQLDCSNFSFHSTKEGFKACTGALRSPGMRVSIPPRKVSRRSGPIRSVGCRTVSIPPRKVSRWSVEKMRRACEGVSIPPRKVSRYFPVASKVRMRLFPFHQGRFQGSVVELIWGPNTRFHSTKEGFKGSWCFLCIAYFSCFHSTKEGFKGLRQNTKR